MATVQEQVNTFRSKYGNVKQLVQAVIVLQVVLIIGVSASIYLSILAYQGAGEAINNSYRAADFAADAAENANSASFSADRASDFSEAAAEYAEDTYYEVKNCL